jgi:hypothetical protein
VIGRGSGEITMMTDRQRHGAFIGKGPRPKAKCPRQKAKGKKEKKGIKGKKAKMKKGKRPKGQKGKRAKTKTTPSQTNALFHQCSFPSS